MELETEYQDTLKFLYGQLPMFTRIGAAAYKPDLANTILLCERLGNPHLKFKSIHIAGTNGKGSCSNLLAVALQKSGYKTALYTSPHIFDFRERIRINGEDITKEYVVNFVEKHRRLIDDIKPSFFELTVAMAFCYFAEQGIDIAVIEVGLGGLLDSTNIITPEVSVITNISNDHAYLLGNTLQEIATQKAGIIKKNIPVVIGETQPESEKVFITKSVMLNSPVFFADNKYSAVNTATRDGRQYIKIIDKANMRIMEVCTDLMGSYQSKNIITVMNTIDVMKSLGWAFPAMNFETVFSDTRKVIGFRGRFDIVKQEPKIIFDVSHNEAGIRELFVQIDSLNANHLHIITGFVKDKELNTILRLFPTHASYYFVQADMPRALPKEELYTMAVENGLHGNCYDSISLALKSALQNVKQEDIILVTGSFFIMEEAYHFIEKNLD